MNTLHVKIDWCDNNFAAVTTDNELLHGMVIATAKTYNGLLVELRKAIATHIADDANVAKWVHEGTYEFDAELGTAALLHQASQYTTLAAISHATGINQTLLSHYATGLKHPRNKQRARIIEGLHNIGQTFLAIK